MSILLNETGAEILKSVRAPEFILPTLLVPTAFYTLFAVVLNQGNNSAAYLLATYGVFAVMGPAVFGFGVGVANEKDRGWLQFKRTLPSPAYTFIIAKLLATLLFCAIALLPIYAIAGFLGGVEMPRVAWLSLFCIHVLSAIPFVFIGLSLGFQFSSAGAVAISNIVYLGLAILGGLWIPVMLFPEWMQSLATLTPSYHLAEIALNVSVHDKQSSIGTHILSSAIMTMLFLISAVLSWSKSK